MLALCSSCGYYNFQKSTSINNMLGESGHENMNWKEKTVNRQYGPSISWPQMGPGWTISLSPHISTDLLSVLSVINDIFEGEENHDYTSLVDFFGTEYECLKSYQISPKFFWTKLCAYIVVRLLPANPPQFFWSDYHEQGFISGSPDWLLEEATEFAFKLLDQSVTGSVCYQSSVEARHSLQKKSAFISKHPFSNAIRRYCDSKNIPFFWLPILKGPFPTIQIGVCNKLELIRSSSSSKDSIIGHYLSSDKINTHFILSHLGVSVPKQVIVDKNNLNISRADLRIVSDMWPVVVKPDQAERGAGITLNIDQINLLRRALAFAQPYANSSIIVQQQCSGDYYRFAILNGQLIRVLKAVPPFIVGDGVSTVEQLIQQANAQHCHQSSSSATWCDEGYSITQLPKTHMGDLIEAQMVPQSGQRITLPHSLIHRSNWFLSEAMDQVHPALAELLLRIARNVSLSNVGIDILSQDLSVDPYLPGANYYVLELNTVQSLGLKFASTYVDSFVGSSDLLTVPIKTLVISDVFIDIPDQSMDCSTYALTTNLYRSQPRCVRQVNDLNLELFVYEHPREVFSCKSVHSVCFVLLWNEFLVRGVATGINHSICFSGDWSSEQESIISHFADNTGMPVELHLARPSCP